MDWVDYDVNGLKGYGIMCTVMRT